MLCSSPTQLDVDGDRRLGVQQGMASLAQPDGSVPPDLRPHSIHFIAQLAPGENQIQMHQGIIIPLDILPMGRRLGGELRQNPLDLLLLLGLQLNILVVGLNHTHGLHKQRRTRGGDVMDQTRQISLVLCLHRHHKPSVPLGDDGLLQHLGIAGGGNDPLEDLAAFGLGRPHMAADIRQFRRCRVGNGILVYNAPLDLLLQVAVSVEGQKEVVNGGLFRRVGVEILLGTPGRRQQIRNRQQLPGVEAAAPVRPVQRLRHRLDTGKGGAAPQADHGPGRIGLVQKAQDLLRLRLRPHGQRPGLGLSTDRLIGQHLQHPGQFQRPDRFIK